VEDKKIKVRKNVEGVRDYNCGLNTNKKPPQRESLAILNLFRKVVLTN